MSISDMLPQFRFWLTTENGREVRVGSFVSLVDEIVSEAAKRGALDDLPGKGQPLHLDRDPYAGPEAEAYRILKNANILPEWLVLKKEIHAEWEALRTEPAGPGQEERLAALNEKVRRYNRIAPPQLQMPLFRGHL